MDERKLFRYIPKKDEGYHVEIDGYIEAVKKGNSVSRSEFLRELHSFLQSRGWEFNGMTRQVDKDGKRVDDIDS